MKKLLSLFGLAFALACTGARAADDFDVSAWDLRADYWPGVARSPVPLYGLLAKQDGQYRFVRFATAATPDEAWVHLPSRRPTWYTGYSSCVYAPFRQRSCPRYSKAQFMDRDVSYGEGILSGLVSFGLVPLFLGVHADFSFEKKKFEKMLAGAYQEAGLDEQRIGRLRADWEILRSRELEGESTIGKARYQVDVDGTGDGALKGISAKWLVAPALEYPWRSISETTLQGFAERLAEATRQYGSAPLKDVARLGMACPHERASEFVAKADCGGVTVAWDAQGLQLSGSMAVQQWRLALPRQMAFDDPNIRVDYDNGALIVRNKELKRLELITISFDAFNQSAFTMLQHTSISKGSFARFLGFAGNGAIRRIERAAPLLTPTELGNTYSVLVGGTYSLGVFRRPEIFGLSLDLVAADTLRAQIDAVQKGELRQSIDEREYVAASAR